MECRFRIPFHKHVHGLCLAGKPPLNPTLCGHTAAFGKRF